jgi:hypothetical protein
MPQFRLLRLPSGSPCARHFLEKATFLGQMNRTEIGQTASIYQRIDLEEFPAAARKAVSSASEQTNQRSALWLDCFDLHAC